MKASLRKQVDILTNIVNIVIFAKFCKLTGGSRRSKGGLVSLSPVKRISSPHIKSKMGLTSTLNVEETIEESTMDRGLLAPNFTYISIHSDTLLNSAQIYPKILTITKKNRLKILKI